MLFKFIFEAFWDKIPRITLANILVFRLVAQPKCAYRTLVESTVPKIMNYVSFSRKLTRSQGT